MTFRFVAVTEHAGIGHAALNSLVSRVASRLETAFGLSDLIKSIEIHEIITYTLYFSASRA